MEWFKNLSKDAQKLLVGVCIFCGSLISLVIGGSISSETVLGISIPMMAVGILGCIVGGICLVSSLINWWEKR